jgi:hypothetical protein
MASIMLGLCLLALGGGMMVWHRVTARQNLAADSAISGDDTFARRQLRRRVRASGLVALLGLFVLLGPLVSNPYLQVIYWTGAMLVVVWVVILAVADIMRTRQHLGELRTQYLTGRAVLEAEVQRRRRENSNGEPAEEDSG